MKKLILLVATALFSLSFFAQDGGSKKDEVMTNAKEDHDFNPGINTLNLQLMPFYYDKPGGYSDLPAVMVSYDIGVHELWSVAPYASLYHAWNNDVNYNWTNLGLGARGMFHFGNMIDALPRALGLYGGFSGGIRFGFSNAPDSNDTDFEYDVFAGARWYFNDNFAVNAEFGYGYSPAKIGVTFKM